MNFSLPSFLATAVAVMAFAGFGVARHLKKNGNQVVFFDPNQTDVLNYAGFRFGLEHRDSETTILTWGNILSKFSAENPTLDSADKRNSMVPTVDILDARKNSNLTFVESGFTLIELLGNEDGDNKTNKKSGSNHEPTDWKDMDQLKLFHSSVIVPELKKLFPSATRFEAATRGKVRGKFMRRPVPVNAIHSDLLLDTKSAVEFYDQFGANELGPLQDAIKKSLNTDGDENEEVLNAIVNIWKPIDMNGPVCDKPLALMDASTLDPKDQRPYRFHVRMWPFVEKDEALTVPVHKPNTQKWYYYPFMTTKEALVFVQYDRNREFFAVPHGAFNNPNCPPGTESRSSVDYRVLVYSSPSDDGRQTKAA